MSSIVKNLCASLETVTLDALVISVVACSDFIKSLLKMNPEERLTAEQALKHKWLTGEVLTFLSTSIYLIYVSIHLSIYLSTSVHLICLSIYLCISIAQAATTSLGDVSKNLGSFQQASRLKKVI